ncbi:MAG TPA: hypothetical protein VHU23_13155 [Rhizomicrobium sp.]|jgi:hypothetical protein|nr:hypothetical protein [Rhizomicrobium sp.]
MTKNAGVELEIAERLTAVLRPLGVLPRDYECEVHLYRGNKRKARTTEFEGNWNPDEDSIRITFAQMEEEQVEAEEHSPAWRSSKTAPAEDRLSDLIRALERAENRPGYEFVSLKWFRDTALRGEGFSWAADDAARYEVLQQAIDQELVRTKKISNPRPPNFPTTAIYLNRARLEVSGVLGKQTASPTGFRPIAIRGESLSTTVLHDRR